MSAIAPRSDEHRNGQVLTGGFRDHATRRPKAFARSRAVAQVGEAAFVAEHVAQLLCAGSADRVEGRVAAGARVTSAWRMRIVVGGTGFSRSYAPAARVCRGLTGGNHHIAGGRSLTFTQTPTAD
jgi:hypothetical protein